MNSRRRSSLRLRLSLVLLALISVTAAGAALAVMPVLRENFLREREQALLTQGSIIASAVREDLLSDGQGLTHIASSYSVRLQSRVLIVGKDLLVLADGYGDLTGSRLELSLIGLSLQGRSVTEEVRMPGGLPVMYAAIPVAAVERLDDQLSELFGVVFISSSLEDIYGDLRQLRSRLLMGAAVVGLLAAVAGLYLAHTVSSPLAALLRGVKSLESGRLGAQVNPGGDREIYSLGESFNRMSTRLAAQESARRRFVADASHELRTPLAATKALIDPILRSDETPPELVRELLADVENEVDRLTALVNDLLQLARLDSIPELELSEVNLRGLTDRVMGSLKPLADVRQIVLTTGGEEVILTGDSALLHRALLNLIDNAIKHARSSVRVTVHSSATLGQVTVSDDGEGIRLEEREVIFQRFGRSDSARDRTGARGSGLGLALAAEIAQLHGGHIDLASVPGLGATFTLAIPLTQK